MSDQSVITRSRRELVADFLGALSPAQERRLLLELLSTELLAVQLYEMAATAGPVSPAGQELARRLGVQERAHAAALARLAEQPAPAEPALSPLAAEKALAAHGITVTLSVLRSERQWFTLLEELERVLERVYFEALGRLTSRPHATLAARIMATEAQHSTLLFSFRNPQDIQLDVAQGQITGRGH
jgi:hypothetical protein